MLYNQDFRGFCFLFFFTFRRKQCTTSFESLGYLNEFQNDYLSDTSPETNNEFQHYFLVIILQDADKVTHEENHT